jgi:hypothetical protein
VPSRLGGTRRLESEHLNHSQYSSGAHVFDYNGWAWALLKPADLFTPAAELTARQERVAMRLWAHANTRTGFTYVTAARIAALMARDINGSRQAGSLSSVNAARAELRRRRFIERATEGGRRGWRLLPPDQWLRASEAIPHSERGKESRAARLFKESRKSRSAAEKVARCDFRQTADIIEGTDQLSIQYNDTGAGAGDAAPESSSPLNDPFVSEMVSLGMSAEEARSLSREFSCRPEAMTTALSNLALDLRRGKLIDSLRGYIADQVLNNRPKKRGLAPAVSRNLRPGEFPACTEDQ